MYKKVYIGAIFIALIIVAGGVFWSKNWLSSTYEPAIATNQFIAQQTAQESTQIYYATSTKIVENTAKTSTAIASQEAYYAAMTQTARPTVTPQLQQICEARVISKNAYINPVPSLSLYHNDIVSVPAKELVSIDGLLYGSDWVHIEYEGNSGFMLSDNLELIDPQCSAEVFDLHFLAGWLPSNWKLLIEETFANNKYKWFDSETEEQLVSEIQNQKNFLPVNSEGTIRIFTAPELQEINYSAATVRVNFGAYPSLAEGYFGIRFTDNSQNIYETRFFTSQCAYAVYNNNELIFDGNVLMRACGDIYYDLVVTINSENTIQLMVNGEEYGPMNLQTNGNSMTITDISFSVFDVHANINYLVVSIPR